MNEYQNISSIRKYSLSAITVALLGVSGYSLTSQKNIDQSTHNVVSPTTKIIQAEYTSPSGTESYSITLDIRSGIIQNSAVTPITTSSDTSLYFIKEFNKAHTTEVIGKKISDISLGRIAGASLTTASYVSTLKTLSVQ